MSSDVDICNSALALLGDDATVASISPPEGSPQADHCARFYPRARRQLLEMHDWSFASRRVALALSAVPPPFTWAYAYALPSDSLSVIGVLAATAVDDYSAALTIFSDSNGYPNGALASAQSNVGLYTEQDYAQETDVDGNGLLYTNQENAVLRYVADVSDNTKFSPLFEECLVLLLASKLAGPLIKGADGRAASQSMLQEFKAWFGQAAASDANDKRHTTQQSTNWLVGR